MVLQYTYMSIVQVLVINTLKLKWPEQFYKGLNRDDWWWWWWR